MQDSLQTDTMEKPVNPLIDPLYGTLIHESL